MFSLNKRNKLLYKHFKCVNWYGFWMQKRMMKGFFNILFLHTEMFPRHWWHSHITDSSPLSSAAHSMSWFRLNWGEDRHVPAGCRLSSSKHWGAGPQQKRTRKRDSLTNSSPPPPLFCMCYGICINNLWEHLVLIPSLLIICCWMSNCWTNALVYIGIGCNRMRWEFDMRSEQKW